MFICKIFNWNVTKYLNKVKEVGFLLKYSGVNTTVTCTDSGSKCAMCICIQDISASFLDSGTRGVHPWIKFRVNTCIFLPCIFLTCYFDWLSSLCLLSCPRDLWVARVLHVEPDQLPVRQRLLHPGVRQSPPCVPAVRRDQTPPLWGIELLSGEHRTSILQRSLPVGLPTSAQPRDRPHVPPVPGLHRPRWLPAVDEAGRQPVRTPSSPPGQQPVPGARGRPGTEPTPPTGRWGGERHREGDAIQRVWPRLSEDAVLLPLQRADADPALHRTVCQRDERMSGEGLNYCLAVCFNIWCFLSVSFL